MSAASDAARRRMEQQRREEEREWLDNARPLEISPPAGRTVQPGWKKRKPIIRGGAVIGRREGGNTA